MDSKDKKCVGGKLHFIKVPRRQLSSVEKASLAALQEARKLFQHKDSVEIVVFSAISDVVIPELGIGAHALSQGDIVVNIDFSRKDIAKIVKRELPSTLFHEFSHVVRKSAIKDPYGTFLDALMTEGIASYIEKHHMKNAVPYISPIKEEQRFLQQAKRAFHKRVYSWKDHSEWFFGAGKLPRWIGYRLGYLIITSFMKKNKNTSVAALVRMKAKDILRGSEV